MFKKFLFFSVLTGAFLCHSLLAQAQLSGFHNPCDQAQNSADVIGCLDARYEEAQNKLTRIYEDVSQALGVDMADKLLRTQRGWISYRDQECSLAQDYAANESLKRAQELSCLLAVTDARTLFLTNFVVPKEEAPPHQAYVSFPVWMNVVAEKHPYVFWQYGGRTAIDLDCDGIDEQVMLGLQSVHGTKDDDSQPAGMNARLENVIAIVEVPETGKPVAHVHKVEIPLHDGPVGQCVQDMRFEQMQFSDDAPIIIDDSNDESDQQCRTGLKFMMPHCDALVLQWSNDGYKFSPLNE